MSHTPTTVKPTMQNGLVSKLQHNQWKFSATGRPSQDSSCRMTQMLQVANGGTSGLSVLILATRILWVMGALIVSLSPQRARKVHMTRWVLLRCFMIDLEQFLKMVCSFELTRKTNVRLRSAGISRQSRVHVNVLI